MAYLRKSRGPPLSRLYALLWLTTIRPRKKLFDKPPPLGYNPQGLPDNLPGGEKKMNIPVRPLVLR
jgi:hypothetical protein